jgi:hypothetical protein
MPVLRATSDSDVGIEPATEPALKQPRTIAIPPAKPRAKSNTDVGAPKADRKPGPPSIPPPMGTRAPTPPPLPPVPPSPQRIHPRGSTPPTGFFVPPAETAEELDRALGEITGERLPPPPKPDDQNEDAEIIVETAPPPAEAAAAPAAAASSPHLSEPEIRIEEIADAADEALLAPPSPEETAAAPNGHADDEDPVEMIMTVEDDSAKIVEVLRDTSSQTMSLTLEEPGEPEITIEPLVAAEDPPPVRRAKSDT